MPLTENDMIRMQYAGAIGLLAKISLSLGHDWESEEHRDSIEKAIKDWCKISGFSYKRILDSFELFTPENEVQNVETTND